MEREDLIPTLFEYLLSGPAEFEKAELDEMLDFTTLNGYIAATAIILEYIKNRGET